MLSLVIFITLLSVYSVMVEMSHNATVLNKFDFFLRPCTVPKLALGIAHDYGAVWCMEWCPSGCYEPPDVGVPECRLRRLGLLGAACSDGTIRIFSICFPSEVQDRICDR